MTKEEIKERRRQYYIKNKEKRLEYQKQYYQENKERLIEYQKQYNQDNKEKTKQYYQENRDKILEQQKQYKQDNKDKLSEYQKQYYQTPIGRAIHLVNGYKQADKKYNRGKGDLTAQWIIDNIFTSKCSYCGKNDWAELGCDRIDNTKPHTMDNVVPCCEECNIKRGTKEYNEFKNRI